MINEALLPCPFCGREVDDDLIDTLYPTGGWRFVNGGKHYTRPNDQNLDGQSWTFHCPESSGGCSAQVSGDSRDEAITAWNKRVDIV